jgi:hypothetical protein
MRTSPVVVLHIDRKDAIEMPGASISNGSRHSARSVSIGRSAKAFAFGALIGVRITRTPSDTKTSLKERGNLASRSLMRKRICVPSLARLITRFLPRRGAGPTPARRRSIAMLVAEAWIPSFPGSPLIRTYPTGGVLPRHRKDQLGGLRVDREAPGPAMRPSPFPRDG